MVGLAAIDGKLYVVGGGAPTGVLNSGSVLELEMMSWDALLEMGAKQIYHGLWHMHCTRNTNESRMCVRVCGLARGW